jgi:hypothetical protein
MGDTTSGMNIPAWLTRNVNSLFGWGGGSTYDPSKAQWILPDSGTGGGEGVEGGGWDQPSGGFSFGSASGATPTAAETQQQLAKGLGSLGSGVTNANLQSQIAGLPKTPGGSPASPGAGGGATLADMIQALRARQLATQQSIGAPSTGGGLLGSVF